MQSGLKPTKQDHRDYDFHRSFGSVAPPQFPVSFTVDNGLWMPNQNVPQTFAVAGQDNLSVPALPFGCTDYTQTDLCMDEDRVLLNPLDLETITHANANQGADIRTSLKAAIQAFGRTAYFNVQRAEPLDWYDSIRLVMLSTPEEKRAVSLGIPWYASFEQPDAVGCLPMPQPGEPYSWHNAAVAGWDGRGLKIKSWQGSGYGEGGWVYMPRAVCNYLMSVTGTCAYTISKMAPKQVVTVDLPFVQWFVSLVLSLFKANTPQVSTPVPVEPAPAPTETPPITPTPTSPTVSLSAFCTEIRNFEGQPGDRNFKNNNPGNCRYSAVGYAAVYKPVLKDQDGFAVFKDYTTGWLYLNNLVKERIAENPAWTFYDFFAVYAPTGDNNNPKHYAETVAGRLTLAPTDVLSKVIAA